MKLSAEEFLAQFRWVNRGLPIEADKLVKIMPKLMQSYADHCEEEAWVSVEDELPAEIPQKQVSALVLIFSGGYRTDVDRYDFDRCRWFSHYGKVTHWRPLPKPPQNNNSK